MPRRILMEQIHVTVNAPARLEKIAYAKIRRTLQSRRFEMAFRKAVRSVFSQFPTLRSALVTVSR